MARNKKKNKNTAKKKTFLFPLALILLTIAAVFLIIFMTQNASKDKLPATPEILTTPSLVGTAQYSSAPPMLIDTAKKYSATITMEKGGSFVIELFADKAPITVNSFVFLAREGYFNGVTFHRVLEDFMAQGGDPTGTGGGNPGYQFVYEDSGYSFDRAGVVAMARSPMSRDTNGSQFFITFGPQPGLNNDYTVFGQVTSGMDVVNGLTRRNPEDNPEYLGDVIASIVIEEK